MAAIGSSGAPPTASYLICTTPRSGSTLLCESLAATGVAGRPDEYFQQLTATGLPRGPGDYLDGLPGFAAPPGGDPRVQPLYDPGRFGGFGEYLAWALRAGTTPNGVFGAKIMSAYVDGLSAGLAEALGDAGDGDSPARLAASFPRLRYIFLVREDKVRQAISLWRAVQTWVWREDAAGPSPDGTFSRNGAPRYSFAAIDHLRRRLAGEEDWWRGYFAAAGIAPLTVVYERFAERREHAVRDVLRFLEIPFGDGRELPSPTMRRQSDDLSLEWAERYAADSPGHVAGRP